MSSKGTPKWVSGEEAKARKLNPPVEGKDSLITRVQYTKAPDAGEVQQLGFINRWIYKWNIATTLELADGWERCVFNTAVIATATTAGYYAYKFIEAMV